MKILIPLILIGILSSAAYSQKHDILKDLNFIVPLKTTKAEVDKRFGKPSPPDFGDVEYQHRMGTLAVTYSRGGCKSDSKAEYDVKKGVVIDYNFSFEDDVKIEFSSLNIKIDEFETEKGDDTPDNLSYKNSKTGYYFATYCGLLYWIMVQPGEKFSRLECKK